MSGESLLLNPENRGIDVFKLEKKYFGRWKSHYEKLYQKP
jgi:hypothetical protein